MRSCQALAEALVLQHAGVVMTISLEQTVPGFTYFQYLNTSKLDSLFSQLNGRLESERTEERAKGLDGKVSA